MNIQTPGHVTLDYQPCRYGGAKIAFRGPSKRLRGNYVSFLGGTETFGPFIPMPFPELTEQKTGLTSINLGCRKGGIDSYLSTHGLIDLCSMGAVTVVQIMGAQYMSNRFYTVDPRRNNRFMRASRTMKAVFFDMDFSDIDTTDDLLLMVAREAPERLHLLRQEIQTAWVARMRTLLRAIDGPKVLLWAADHAPHSAGSPSTFCREPMFIDRAMLNAIESEADHLIEVVVTQEEVVAGFAQMQTGPADFSAAIEMLGPVAHRRIAEILAPLLKSMVEPDDIGEVNFFRHAAKH